MIPQPIDTVPLFQRLAEEERQQVTARLKRRQVSPGETVIAEGQPSDTLFIVTAGWVKLESGNANHIITLANLGAGSLIGEADTLLNRPYSMTARAAGTSSTQLLTLSRTDLEELIIAHPSIGLKFSAVLGLRISFLEKYLVQQRLPNIELLTALSEDDLREIAERLDFHWAARGDLLIETGTPGDTAYFIEEGHVRLIANSREGESFEELGEGDIFGHTAIITGKNYTATARAITDVSAWVLKRSVYQDLIRRRPAIKLAFSRALAETLSPGDQSDAMERMRQLQLFADLPEDALAALAARLVLRNFPADEAIYTEGTPGDAMYLVESGEVKLMDSAFSDAHLLERAHNGESFGEMALLTGRTRAECARAATDATLWVLYKTDFDDVMVQYPEISASLSRTLTQRLASRESDFVIRHLRRISLFGDLAASELKLIAKQVRGLRFRPGEIICFAGQPVHTLFLIENGEVKRITPGPDGQPIAFDILDAGDSFGEQEIVQSIPYTATAQAMGDVELWTIAKNDFQRMLQEYPALALAVTRMMAEQLTRAQSYPQRRTMPSQPRGNMPIPPRAPTARPNMGNVPPPGGRIQQPPSGARQIKPMAQSAEPQPRANSSVSHIATQNRPPAVGSVARQHAQTSAHTHQPASPHAQAHATQHATQHTPQHATPPLPRSARAPASRKQNNFASEFGTWARELSLGAKLRVLTLGLLIIWIALIALPFTTITTVSSAFAGLQVSNPGTTNSGTANNKPAIAQRTSGSSDTAKVAFAVPTDTPVPTRTPQPTFTPRPKPTLVPVTRTPPPPPAPAIAAAPAATPVPALPAVYMDPRIGDPARAGAQVLPHLESVRIIPAAVAHGQKFWRVVSIKFENIDESGSDHTIYVKVLDETGKRVDGKKAHLIGENSQITEYPDEKPAADMCNCNFNYPMYGDAYDFTIEDQYPSDTAAGMIMPMRRHVNFRVTFQLTTNP